MELLVLLALVVVGLSVLIRRHSYTGARRAGAPAPAAVVIQKIANPAIAHRMLVENADDFSDRPVASFLVALEKSRGGKQIESLLSVPHGPLWRALRCNITAETLHPSRLGHIAPLQRDAIQGIVAALGKELPAVVAVREHLFAAVFSVVARLCFGDDLDEGHVRAMRCVIRDIQRFAEGGAKASPGSTRAMVAEWRRLRRQLSSHNRMGQLCLPLVAARRECRRPRDGRRPYVDSLIDLRVPDDGDGGRRALRDDEFVSLLSEFLGAGTGTVVANLEWTLAHLVNDQEVQKRLRDEVIDGGDVVTSSDRSLIRGMPFMNAVVLESLRMHPPVPFIQRHVQTQAARELGDVGITRDVIVQFRAGDIGRDNKTWTDPDEFRPERFLPGGEAEDVGPLPGPKEIRMMPFGAGHRFCPGVGLGMVNIKCFLAALVREFEWTPPPMEGCAGVDLTELNGFIKLMKKPLSARLTRYS